MPAPEGLARRRIGRTGPDVTFAGFGAVQVGNLFRFVTEEESRQVIDAAWDAGLRYFDTAPLYGFGLSELRIGQALRWRDRDDFVLSSKVGRVLEPGRCAPQDAAPWVRPAAFRPVYDYSYDGTMRAFEQSLQRLALERMDICFIHDIDVWTHGNRQPEMFDQAMNGAWKALARLKDEGVLKAIGVGVNEWQVCRDALLRRDFDCFLLAGRYTLLEQDALDGFFPLCRERGASVIVGGGFNSGILATGAVPGARYNYHEAPPEILARVAGIEAVCRGFDVPLQAAALQFVTAHPAVASFVTGTRSAEQLRQNVGWLTTSIPAGFWAQLKHDGLLRADAPTPA